MESDRWPCATGIVEAFERALEHPRRLFLEDAAGTLTYGEVCQRIRKVAGVVGAWGLRPGDRVILASKEDRATSVLFLALLRCGLTPVLLDPATGGERARRLIAVSRPSAYMLDEGLGSAWGLGPLPRVLPIAPEAARGILERFRGPVPSTYPACLESLPPANLPGSVDPGSDAYVLFTSGTTTDPKGVRILHRSLFAHLATLGGVYGYDPNCRIFNNLILSHTDGIIQGPVIAFAHGLAVYRTVGLAIQDLPRVLDELYRLRITHFVTVPAILALLLRTCEAELEALDAVDLRLVVSCGAQLEAALWRRSEALLKVPLVNMYGLTETVTGGLFAGPDPATRRYGTVGKPVDCEARIRAPEGQVLEGEAPGELELRGAMVMAGYLHAPAATAAVLEPDGWFRTGDLASREADGCIRIIGRKKALIIRGGFNVHPEEVTEALHRHPSVLEAVTFGIADPIWGERVVSAVVVDRARPVGETDLIGHCRLHLEEPKVPSRILQVQELPRGRSLKVQLEAVKRLVEAAPGPAHAGAEAPPDLDIQQGVLAEASACFRVPVEALDGATSPATCPGWDSLGHLNFIGGLEQRFDIQFRPDEILAIGSLRHATQLVVAKCLPG